MLSIMNAFKFVECISIVLFYNFAEINGQTLNGSIRPLQPVMRTGELNISCSLPAISYVDDTRVTSQNLYFSAGEVMTSNSVIVDELTINLTLRNVSRFHSHVNLFCYANISGVPHKVAQSKIIIIEPLVAPRLKGCVVYNWTEMTCEWEPADPDFGIRTDTVFYYSVHCLKMFSICNLEVPGQCRIKNFFLAQSYCVQVCFNNSESRACSNMTLINPFKEVKPAPVRVARQNILGRSAEIELCKVHEKEKANFYLELRGDGKIQEITTNETKVPLINLRPYTNYTITVRSIPLVKDERKIYVEKGYFSNPNTFVFQTKPDVPDENPKLLPGSFHFEYSISPVGKAYVDIFWQKVDEKFQNGKLKYTSITYWEWGQNKSEEIGTLKREECNPKDNIFQLKSQIDRGKDYMIEIQTVNEKGSNPDIAPSRLIIPSVNRAPMSPDHFYATFINNDVQLEWTKVEEACGYTVYWCYQHFSTRNCQSKYGIQWQDNIPPESTNLVIPFHNLDLKAGISVEKFDSELNQTVSSGVTWARCIHKKGAPILPPRNLHFSPHQNPNSLVILWSHPECSKSRYISNYEIVWCKRVPDICAGDLNDTDCCPKNASILVPRSSTSWLLKDLDPDFEYEVGMRSFSFDASSEFAPTISRKVQGNGYSKAIIALVVIASVLGFIICPLIIFKIHSTIKEKDKLLKITTPGQHNCTSTQPNGLDEYWDIDVDSGREMPQETDIDAPEVHQSNGSVPNEEGKSVEISQYTVIHTMHSEQQDPVPLQDGPEESHPTLGERDAFLHINSLQPPSPMPRGASEYFPSGRQGTNVLLDKKGKGNDYV